MKDLNAYLIFNGNCRQAMEFYRQCLGGELTMMKYSEIPGGAADLPKETQDWIIHARLNIKSLVLMASDSRPEHSVMHGSNFFISLNADSVKDAETLFQALSVKGTVEMPLQETFWAERFAMLTDQFGIKWMINLDKPKGK